MGQLPFISEGQVLDQGGAVLGTIACTVWQTGRTVAGPAGMHADHEGEADLAGADLIEPPRNRSLVVDGATYKIVDASRQPYVPHVALLLRKTDPR